MKVGNVVGGLSVIDVKRVNKMNVIQFTKAIAEYIEQGYKLDVHSARQIGLVLSVDVFKTGESAPNESVLSTTLVTEVVEGVEKTSAVEDELQSSEVSVKKSRSKKLAE